MRHMVFVNDFLFILFMVSSRSRIAACQESLQEKIFYESFGLWTILSLAVFDSQ